MGKLSAVLVLVAFTLLPSRCRAENPVYDELMRRGVPIDFREIVRLPAPTVADGLTAAKQRQAIEAIADGRSWEELTRRSVNAPFVFKNAVTGTYYLQVTHRNALETWSKSGGETFTKGTILNFDFTSAKSQSYGSNSVSVGGKWCMFSGDVIKDGLIELSDLLEIYNNATSFASGYIVSDLTGEGTVDLSDILLVYNNSTSFVSKKTPEISALDISTATEKAKMKLIEFNKNKETKQSDTKIVK